MGGMALRRAFARRDFTMLIETVNDLNQAILNVKAQTEIGKTVLEADAFGLRPPVDALEMIEAAVIAALIVLAENGRPLDIFVLDWRKAADTLSSPSEVAAFIMSLEKVLTMPGLEFARIQQNASEPLMARLGAAVRMCIDSNLPLSVMFIGQAFLLDYVNQCSMRDEIEDVFGSLIRTHWLRRLDFAAALPTPRLTVPAIQRACSDGSRGIRLAARIFLQAQFAVTLTVPLEVITKWQKLAAD